MEFCYYSPSERFVELTFVFGAMMAVNTRGRKATFVEEIAHFL